MEMTALIENWEAIPEFFPPGQFGRYAAFAR
jgi:hypothetical protein